MCSTKEIVSGNGGEGNLVDCLKSVGGDLPGSHLQCVVSRCALPNTLGGHIVPDARKKRIEPALPQGDSNHPNELRNMTTRRGFAEMGEKVNRFLQGSICCHCRDHDIFARLVSSAPNGSNIFWQYFASLAGSPIF